MGKASRAKRRRAAVRSAKRSRQNNWWYGLTALVVIVGVALVVYAHATQPAPVGPYVLDQVNQTNPHNRDSHWHAALGVYKCDHWLGDQTGEGIWNWPAQTPSGSPARANNTNVYAGLHSHDDGIIHMEPAVTEEAGRHATVGKYFEFGGWSLSSSGFDFLGNKAKNGDMCSNQPGTLQWATATFDGNVSGKQKYTVRTGDPASWKLHNDDIVIIAFLPPGKSVTSLGNPPSLKNLPDAAQRSETAMNNTNTATTGPTGSVPSGATPTTAKP